MDAQLELRLSAAERDQLAECETTIERGLKTFNEVGSALMNIRDNRLYRAEFPTFEDYAEQRWGFTKQRANQLVAASAVAELISTTVVVEIKNEAQARELAPLLDEPETLREVYAEVVERTGGKPTAAAIRQVREERQPVEPQADPPPPAPAPVPPPEQWTADESKLLDALRQGETIVVSQRGQHDNLVRWAEAAGRYVRIDRRTEWGNPFETPADGDREAVIANYEAHYLPHKPSLLSKLDGLRGKALGCWCAPERCHGDVLAAWAEGRGEQC